MRHVFAKRDPGRAEVGLQPVGVVRVPSVALQTLAARHPIRIGVGRSDQQPCTARLSAVAGLTLNGRRAALCTPRPALPAPECHPDVVSWLSRPVSMASVTTLPPSTTASESSHARPAAQSSFVVTSRPAMAAPLVLTQRPVPESTSGQLKDWVQVDVSDGKEKGRADLPKDVRDTDRIRLTWDAKGRRMVNQ
jgi:hypothetical protein